MTAMIHTGDALTVLRTLQDASARCCVTSPPYWGLRDYGMAGQLGLESTPAEYVEKMVQVFREVRRVLTDDGTLWLNLGDSYTGGKQGRGDTEYELRSGRAAPGEAKQRPVPAGMKPKDLVGIPWRVAFALQADGWYLRSDIIWAKPNPMPESVTDRPTKSHEYLFLLSKSATYYYDAAAIAEELTTDASENYPARARVIGRGGLASLEQNGGPHQRSSGGLLPRDGKRNARSVWTIATQPYAAAHFATFPEELSRRCILAGSAPGDTVLDPFAGSGTVGQVATGHGRRAILIELNPEYVHLMRQRIGPLLCGAA